jgi:hypothetical protein
MLLQLFSREVKWGTGPCEPFQGVNLNLSMLFPPVPSSLKCFDTLIIAIRYTFTDCKCVTCDVLHRDTIIRKPIIVPWDPTGNGVGWTRGTAKSGAATQADTATTTSLVMADKDNGTLWVVNPNVPENTTTVLGAEVTSPVTLTALASNGNDGVMNGAVGFVGLDCPPGVTAGVDLTFNNALNQLQFPVIVRYLFAVDGGDPLFSEPIEYTARVPGGDPDKMDADATNKPANVRTYALSFTNANGYRAPIGSIRIRSESSARFLAVGPAGTDASQVLLAPIANDGGSFMVSAVEQNGQPGVAPGQIVKPMYVTLSDVQGATADFSFTSYDVTGQPISDGTFTLSDPISGIRGDVDVRPLAQLGVTPNPAAATVTITATLERSVPNATVTVQDLQGRTVLSLVDRSMDFGNHIITADVESLQPGTYFIVMQSALGIVSQPLTVVR